MTVKTKTPALGLTQSRLGASDSGCLVWVALAGVFIAGVILAEWFHKSSPWAERYDALPSPSEIPWLTALALGYAAVCLGLSYRLWSFWRLAPRPADSFNRQRIQWVIGSLAFLMLLSLVSAGFQRMARQALLTEAQAKADAEARRLTQSGDSLLSFVNLLDPAKLPAEGDVGIALFTIKSFQSFSNIQIQPLHESFPLIDGICAVALPAGRHSLGTLTCRESSEVLSTTKTLTLDESFTVNPGKLLWLGTVEIQRDETRNEEKSTPVIVSWKRSNEEKVIAAALEGHGEWAQQIGRWKEAKRLTCRSNLQARLEKMLQEDKERKERQKLEREQQEEKKKADAAEALKSTALGDTLGSFKYLLDPEKLPADADLGILFFVVKNARLLQDVSVISQDPIPLKYGSGAVALKPGRYTLDKLREQKFFRIAGQSHLSYDLVPLNESFEIRAGCLTWLGVLDFHNAKISWNRDIDIPADTFESQLFAEKQDWARQLMQWKNAGRLYTPETITPAITPR